MVWPGAGLVIGSGIGIAFGVIFAGGTGVALGAAFGGGIGLVVGSLVDAILLRKGGPEEQA